MWLLCVSILLVKKSKINVGPLEHDRHSGSRTPLQSFNDLGGFVTIDAIHSTALDDLRGPSKAVI